MYIKAIESKRKKSIAAKPHKQMLIKGEGGGLPKYLWDSSLEETNEKGEAMSANNGSTAHYAG